MTSPTPQPVATGVVELDQTTLRSQMEHTLQRHGVPADDAVWVVETMLRGEREGARGHGLVRFPLTVRRLAAGLVKPAPTLRRVQDTAGTALVDGDNGLGQVVIRQSMLIALEKARSAGVGFVAVRNSNHAGRIGDAALVAAENGCLGLAGSNASPRLVSGPGAQALLGNNPIACAAPGTDHPMLIDLSPGSATVGSIRLAALEGRPLPDGVALDRDGEPTTDAHAGLAGGMLGVGGHKGWVLALLVDILAGMLSEGAMADEVGATSDLAKPQRVAHFVLAVDLAAFLSPGTFEARLDDLRDRIQAAGGDQARLPGDRRAEQAPAAADTPLRVSAELAAALRESLEPTTAEHQPGVPPTNG